MIFDAAILFQLTGQPQADAPAASNDHAAHRLIANPKRVEHLPNPASRGKNKHLVARLDSCAAVADHLLIDTQLVGSVDRDKAHFDIGYQLGQL